MSTTPRDDQKFVTPGEAAEHPTIAGDLSQGAVADSVQTLVEPASADGVDSGLMTQSAQRLTSDATLEVSVDPLLTETTSLAVGAGETIADASVQGDPSAQTIATPRAVSPPAAAASEAVTIDVRADSPPQNNRTIAGDSASGASSPGSATAHDAVSRRSPMSPSLTIGRFAVQRVLGQGAFGTVYLGHDSRLDRPVAIKVAKTGLLSGKADVDRFQREARSAAQLRHPHIVPVYEFGESHHASYIAYEFIKGRTLKGYLEEKGKLQPEEAATLIRKLALALSYAHSHGIVHRDMKPDNVLIDEEGEPHIADFGLARRDEGDVTRTREGLFMGTPAYMSPEQASGKAHLADGRADVWSLGVMLWEMLTGRRPFEGKLTEVLRAVVDQEPPPIRQLDPRLPEDLETICQKCLAKSPEGRFQTGEELADELERWQRGEPILSRPISVLARTGRWMKRNPEVAQLIGAVCLTFLLGTIFSLYFGISANQQFHRAQLAERNRAISQLDSLLTTAPAAVPSQIADLAAIIHDSPHSAEGLREHLNKWLLEPGSEESLRTRLALVSLFPRDSRAAAALQLLAEDLLTAPPAEATMASRQLTAHTAELSGPLWATVRGTVHPPGQRLRAAAALAALDPKNPSWSAIASDLVIGLSVVDELQLPVWIEAFTPVRDVLRPELTRQFAVGETARQRRSAGILLTSLFSDDLASLLEFLPNAQPDQVNAFVTAFSSQADRAVPLLRQRFEELRASKNGAGPGWEPAAVNLACVLISLEDGESVWPSLGDNPDRRFRSLLIDQAALSGVDWTLLQVPLNGESDPVIRAGLVLALGNYGPAELPPSSRRELRQPLLDLFTRHPHPAIHSATDWTLRRFGFEGDLQAERLKLRSKDRVAGRGWHVDPRGVTFAVVEGPVEFRMGCSPGEPETVQQAERPHQRLIPRTFGIAMREVTVDEYLSFQSAAAYDAAASPNPQCPINTLRWYDAARYCRWLSEQEGVPEDEMCYPPLDQIQDGMTLPSNLLDRTGYRLPTAAEWEYACRAGASGRRPWSDRDELFDRYCWYESNSSSRMWPVGTLKPNELGLFDGLGNALEWTQDWYFEQYPSENADGVVIDGDDRRQGVPRELRGGGIEDGPQLLKVYNRDKEEPYLLGRQFGFRLCRTYRSGPTKSATDAN